MTSHSRLKYVIDNLLKCLSETQGADARGGGGGYSLIRA